MKFSRFLDRAALRADDLLRRCLTLCTVAALVSISLLAGCDSGNSDDEDFSFGFRQNDWLIEGTVALERSTGEPYRFVHVRLGGSSGSGSAESPYGTLDQALSDADPGTVIYVRAGSNPGIGRFTVPEGVVVISDGPQVLLPTRRGEQVVPESNQGILPRVSGTVTLSNASGVIGFEINASSGPGVEASNVGDLRVTHNLIPSPAGEGVILREVTGTVEVSDNTVSDTGDGGHDGILVENTTGSVTVVSDRNTISNTTGSGINIVSRGDAETDGTVRNNVIETTMFSGIKFFNRDDSRVKATVIGNQTSGNTRAVSQDAGVRIGAFEDCRVEAIVQRNVVADNVSSGIFMGSERTSVMDARIQNNVLMNNSGNGIFYGSQEESTVTGIVSGNVVSGSTIDPMFPFPPNAPKGNGIFVGSRGDSYASVEISDNTTVENQVSGIYFFVANRSLSDFTIEHNRSNGNGASGIEVVVGINSPLAGGADPGPPPPPGTVQGNALIANNTTIGNAGFGPTPEQGGGGITIRSLTASLLNADVRGNTLASNANHPNALGGMALQSVAVASMRAGVRYNRITESGTPHGFIAQSVGQVPGGLCLDLADNRTDAAYVLLRTPEASFRADLSNNRGGVVQPGAPVESLGDCAVPTL